MQQHREITLQRLEQFAQYLKGSLYSSQVSFPLNAYAAPGRIPYAQAVTGDYRPVRLGDHLAPPWSTHWFKIEAEIPAAWAGQEVHLRWDSSSEACVWRDGQPVQGLSGTGEYWHSPYHDSYVLATHAPGGEAVRLYLEVAVNTPFGVDEGSRLFPSGPQLYPVGLLRRAEIALFRPEIWDLLWDFVTVADMAKHLPPNTPRAGQALAAANQMVNLFQPDAPETIPAARAVAAHFLAAHNGDGQHTVFAVGHAHIDTAWLWPLAETRRKCVRTFSTALRLMERYPDYKFVCSQAQQFAWIKESQPELYAQIRQRVAEGRFIPVGGSWVEPDCNIPAGESFVRQFLYGQRFFQQEFGLTSREFWLPDTFGYSAALPQIMRGVGIEYFLTQKLSWNQFNKPTVSTFHWQGLDGSRVLTHFPPADTYNGLANVEELVRSVQQFKNHERSNASLYPFGFGDGGGGPNSAMLARLDRMRDVDGLPRVVMQSPAEFFEQCAAGPDDFTVWAGELYFERHRGTYTTQAYNKWANRKSELLLRDVEFLSALLPDYPAETLETLWKMVLTNQFHDILPGSSIREVYHDSAQDYAHILKTAEALRDQALTRLLADARFPHPQPLPHKEGGASEPIFLPAPLVGEGPGMGGETAVAVVNTLSQTRWEVIELPPDISIIQHGAEGSALAVVEAPPMGWRVQTLGETPLVAVTVVDRGGTFVLENSTLRAILSHEGHLLSLVDKSTISPTPGPSPKKREGDHRVALPSPLVGEGLGMGAGREVLAAPGNHFVLFDDHPLAWDAWDVDVFHLEKRQEIGGAVRADVVEQGPLRAAVRFEYRLSESSTLRQTVLLTCTAPYLEFVTEVDWHEQHQFLKVEFPLNVHTLQATYETQYGLVQRPTHSNTSWDLARFEVCGHRWGALIEYGFGVALLNDSKYGYSAQGNLLALSLLRSPTWPDATADQGNHQFRYALYPFNGQVEQAVAAGLRFNVPLLVQPAGSAPAERSYFSVEPATIVLDAVKKAEDSDALIVRLYEACGGSAAVALHSSLTIQKVMRCNLLEVDEAELDCTDGTIRFEIAPFKVVTLKVYLTP